VPWLNHPSYVRARDAVIAAFKNKTYVFRRLGHVVFLCGGAGSKNRDALAGYLRKHHKEALVFYADTVWQEIASAGGHSGFNALEMEEQLAMLADIVIIIVESPGTIAELGAFCLSPALRSKLLPLNDLRFKCDLSFINTGPIAWINVSSQFAPSIYSDHKVILSVARELEDRLARLPKASKTRIDNLAESPKHLLFLLCDLAAVIGPAPLAHFDYYLAAILDSAPRLSVATLLELAAALDIISRKHDGSRVLYFRPPKDDTLQEYQHRKLFSLAQERSRILSVMQAIPEAAAALLAIAP
jgi:hypothetical protein